MKRTLAAIALVALLVAPATSASAQRDPAPYPETLTALLDGWIDEAARLGENHQDAEWYEEAVGYLVKAQEAAAQGRVRVTMFHLETYSELTLAGTLTDEAAHYASSADKKQHILSRTNVWRQEAEDAWTAYRARLHDNDDLRSLHAIELALYSADIAVTGYTVSGDYDMIAREFTKAPEISQGFVHALVRASHSPSLNIAFADDVLDVAVEEEGLPPRVNETVWQALRAEALAPAPEGEDVPPWLERYETIAQDARANNETLLSMDLALAQQRAQRAHGMTTIFGDAQSRGKDIIADAARGMNKTLANTTLDTAHSYGLLGVFTSDAIDRAIFTHGFIEREQAELGTIVVTWSALDHQGYVLRALGAASPVQPPEVDAAGTDEKDTPAAGVAAALAVLALVAVAKATGRRRG